MSRWYTLFLYFVCTLFLVLYGILCWHSRLATDDYSYIWEVYNYGVLKEVYVQYTLWSGRIAATLLTDAIYQLLDVDQTWYFLYPLCAGVLLFLGTYRAIATVAHKYELTFSASHRILAAFLFTCTLFFMTFDIGETWFWYNSISHYLGSVIAFIWGIGFLFGKRSSFLTMLLCCLCFFYAGSASEVYSVVYTGFFIALLYFDIRNKAKNKQLRIAATCFFLSFLITIVAPGNYVRASFFPKPGLISTINLTFYMMGKLFFWFLPQKLHYLIAFAGPFIILGNHYSKENESSLKTFIRKAGKLFLLLLLSCLIVFSLIAFIMSQSGEYRIWFILSFLFSIYICALCFYFGYHGLLKNKYIGLLKMITILTGILTVLYTITGQFKITRKYALAHDQRVYFLKQMNERVQKDTLIVLPLLPPPGFLYSAEITSDPYNFLNEELKQGYRLKFHVTAEKKVP